MRSFGLRRKRKFHPEDSAAVGDESILRSGQVVPVAGGRNLNRCGIQRSWGLKDPESGKPGPGFGGVTLALSLAQASGTIAAAIHGATTLKAGHLFPLPDQECQVHRITES